MKTLEEINAYLLKHGSNDESIDMIMAFLVGKGLYDIENDEIEYVTSQKTFKDFLDWYNGKQVNHKFEDDDFEVGDYIHVDDNIDVVVVSDITDGKFVGWNGDTLRVYTLGDSSRPCETDECSSLAKKCNESGIVFDDLFEILDDNDKNEQNKQELRDALNELDKELENVKDIPLVGTLLKKIAEKVSRDAREFLNDDENEKFEDLRVKAHEAIDRIVDNIKNNEMPIEERELLNDAFKTLVELGKMYE